MGGFEGGDEAGFWDEESIDSFVKKQHSPKSIEKKRVSFDGERYTIEVFMQEESLGILHLEPSDSKAFRVDGSTKIPEIQESITEAYKQVVAYTKDPDIEDFFVEYTLCVKHNLSEVSREELQSFSLAFLCLCKEACNLVVSFEELERVTVESLA